MGALLHAMTTDKTVDRLDPLPLGVRVLEGRKEETVSAIFTPLQCQALACPLSGEEGLGTIRTNVRNKRCPLVRVYILRTTGSSTIILWFLVCDLSICLLIGKKKLKTDYFVLFFGRTARGDRSSAFRFPASPSSQGFYGLRCPAQEAIPRHTTPCPET